MKNILITGEPGVGKTTLLMKMIEIFKEFNPAGFYTTEIVENGTRIGFELVGISGETELLAHTSFQSKYIIGKYKVNVKGFDKFLDQIFLKEKKKRFYIIDEIGKMECKSRKFSNLIIDLFVSDKTVIASISDKGTGLISDIKKRNDVVILELTRENSERRLKELTLMVRDLLMD